MLSHLSHHCPFHFPISIMARAHVESTLLPKYIHTRLGGHLINVALVQHEQEAKSPVGTICVGRGGGTGRPISGIWLTKPQIEMTSDYGDMAAPKSIVKYFDGPNPIE